MSEANQINTALDIPSMKEMNDQIGNLSLFGLLLNVEMKAELLKLKGNFKSFVETIDKFYSTLGNQNWIFHEMLNLDQIHDILSNPGEDYQEKFISIYTNKENLDFFIRQLGSLDQMKIRNDLILKAKNDYLLGRYYSTVFILLAIIDGFVNDFERQHKGFHARDESEFGSLDSVVAHHQGISRIHRIYTKTCSRTSADPVFELYRNGIMHGTILNFDNIVVATKAWNLLFSIKDWAVAKLKEEQPKKQEKSWREIFSQLKDNQQAKQDLEQWSPYEIGLEDSNISDESVYISCNQFLNLWKHKNYGDMSKFTMTTLMKFQGSLAPKLIRDIYSNFTLEDYEIQKINHCAPAISEVSIQLKLKGSSNGVKIFRWIYEDADGRPLTFNGNIKGSWRLVIGYQ